MGELERLNTSYKQIQAGVETPINLQEGVRSFTDVRLQLVLLTLPRFLGLPETVRPQPNESIGQFLDRIIADAKKTKNWPLLLKAEEASHIISNTGNAGVTWFAGHSAPLKAFVMGQNQEQAGQYVPAVVSYENALLDTDGMVPIDIVHDRLAAIEKNHPSEYKQGVQMALEAPDFRVSVQQDAGGNRPERRPVSSSSEPSPSPEKVTVPNTVSNSLSSH